MHSKRKRILYWTIVWITLTLYLFFLTRAFNKFCIDFDQKINAWIFVFVISDLLIHTNLTFGGIFILSSIEWDDFNSIGMAQRKIIKIIGPKLFQILMRSLFYTILIYITSILVFIPNLSFGWTWGAVIKTFAKSYSFNPTYIPFFSVSANIIRLYEPIVANFLAGLLFVMYLVFIGWILGAVNVITHSKWLGSVAAIMITLFDLDINNNLATNFYWVSPSSLSRFSHLHELNRPESEALLYSIKFLIILIFFVIFILYLYNRLMKRRGEEKL